MSPGGLAKPTTILLLQQQQDAYGVGDISSTCSVRQKNKMNNIRISCILADWPSPRPGINCYNNLTAGRRLCRDASAMCSVRQNTRKKSTRIFGGIRGFLFWEMYDIQLRWQHIHRKVRTEFWGTCWETVQYKIPN